MSGRKPLAGKLSILTLNLALAVLMHLLAPAEPIRSDRLAYDASAQAPFAPGCTNTIYCYRPLAPVLVHALPLDPDLGWRVYQVTAVAVAGTILASLTTAPVVASVMVQTSYGFTFTAYDPYAADPLVFAIAALMAWCWTRDRVMPAIALAAIGVFAKETVALIAGALALAALWSAFVAGGRPDRAWKPWLLPAVVSGTLLAAFHAIGRLWLGWEIGSNAAAQLSQGSWIGLWLRNNPSHVLKLYMLFSVFGFAWIFALLGWRRAAPAWRALALGTIGPMLMLMVVQTPERALGNLFFLVIPFATLAVTPAPAAGMAAVILNGLVTAKAGTSSVWLPSARWTLIPAAIAAVCLIVIARKHRRTETQSL